MVTAVVPMEAADTAAQLRASSRSLTYWSPDFFGPGFDSVGPLGRIGQLGPGCDFLVRAEHGHKVQPSKEFGTGDELVEIRIAPGVQRIEASPPTVVVARGIRDTSGTTEVMLLTILMDPVRFLKEDMAVHYRQRSGLTSRSTRPSSAAPL